MLKKLLPVWLVLFFVLASGWAVLNASASPIGPMAVAPPASRVDSAGLMATQEITDYLTTERHNYWAVGGGFVYWSAGCFNVDDPPNQAFLRRKPLTGGSPITIKTISGSACKTFANLYADDDGVYYKDLNTATPQLISWPIGAGSPITVANLEAGFTNFFITSDADRLYFTQSGGIYRANKDSFGAGRISDATGLNGIVVDDTYVYFLSDTALQRSLKTCTGSTCWNNKTTLMSGFTDSRHLQRHGDYMYFFYYWPSDGLWNLGRTPLGPGFLHMHTLPEGMVYNGPTAVSGDYLFWLEYPGTTLRLQRMPLAGGPVKTVAETEPNGILLQNTSMSQLYGDTIGVILRKNNFGPVYRLPYNLQPITRDLGIDDWLVIQTVQNRDHDAPLIANKTTYALLYGRLITGTRANNTEAVLHITDAQGDVYQIGPENGALSLVAGTQFMITSTTQVWYFRLPEFMLDPGNVTLRAELDPRGIYDDPNPANDQKTRTFTFNKQNPACVVFIPVRTHNSLPSTEDPNFWDTINRYRRLWPVPDVWVYHQNSPAEELEICWLWGFIPYPCNGPYELNEGAKWDDWVPDAGEALLDIQARESFSDDPDECDGDSWAVQYVGMVHPQANTDDTNGMGALYFDAAWVKMAPHTQYPTRDWQWPKAGVTLAHETTHNYDRGHVDCPVGKPEDIDHGYPYDSCMLDDGPLADPDTYYGFDVDNRQLLWPTGARDYMAYGSGRWTSDYTWKNMYHNILDIEEEWLLDRIAGPSAPTAADEVAAALSVVMLNGAVELTGDQGKLGYAWVYPSGALSRGLLRKWQALAVPQAAYFKAGVQGQAALQATALLTYHVQLLDAGGAVLDDRVVTPSKMMGDGGLPYTGTQRFGTFALTIPAPTNPVASLRLMTATTVLDTLTPGQHSPTIELFSPAGGEVFDSSMAIRWHADDPDNDNLLYSIQYSPDGGLHWNALLLNFPWPSEVYTAELALDDISDIHGTIGITGSLIRVAASDGYNTVIATSQLFSVTNRPPEAVIYRPQPNQIFEAGETIAVEGAAYDVEDGGNIPVSEYSWELDGQGVGSYVKELNFPGLAPGDHDIALTVEDSQGAEDTIEKTVTVLPLYIPQRTSGITMTLDGLCDDSAYAQFGDHVSLPPYGGGSQATVRMLRTSTYLWVCFTGLQSGQQMYPTATVSIAGLLVDGNYSRNAVPQTNDYAFFISEDGTPLAKAGDGTSGFNNPGPSGYAVQTSGSEGIWNAEMRIDSTTLGGWDHLAGLAFIHYNLYPYNLSFMHAWPQTAKLNQPSTWGKTALGKMPSLESLTSNTADVTSGSLIFGLTGKNFSNATVLWNGNALATVNVGSTFLMATIPAGYLATPGLAIVKVRNGTSNDFSSNSLYFVVTNPDPDISSLNPATVEAGSPAFTLVITGTDFVSGAKVLWNGQARTTTFVSSTRLTTQISAADVETARSVGVAVLNPVPGGGTSPALTFEVARSYKNAIYLPLVLRNAP